MSIQSQTLSVHVTSPNGGETFQQGQQVLIQWQSTGAASHVVKLSTDGGASYPTDISPQLSGTAQSFLWTANVPPTTQARIRVAARDGIGNRVTDDSDAVFSIISPSAPVVSSVSPNTGPVAGGTQVTISGQNFVSGCTAKFGGVEAQTTFVASSRLNAVTPAQTSAGPVKVRVDNPDQQSSVLPGGFQYVEPQATTVQVIAPVGGAFQAGQQLTVQWQTTGPVSSHAVRLSFDGGPFNNVTTDDLPGSARSFTFTLPPPPVPSSLAVIRVAAKDATGSQIAKGDSPSFSVQPPPPTTVIVTSPTGGTFQPGQSVTVQWQTSGPVSFHVVRLSYDGVTFNRYERRRSRAHSPGPTEPHALGFGGLLRLAGWRTASAHHARQLLPACRRSSRALVELGSALACDH